MGQVTSALSDLVQSIVAFIVMIIMAIVGFYFTVFVVSTGAAFAGYSPSGDFVVLSAALLVVAAILAGGISPIGYLSQPVGTEGPARRVSSDDAWKLRPS